MFKYFIINLQKKSFGKDSKFDISIISKFKDIIFTKPKISLLVDKKLILNKV